MSTDVHPTAIVDPAAELGDGVTVAAYAIIDAEVRVGDGCRIGPYSRLTGDTIIGERNTFESHCSVGAPPQDLKYAGEPTRLEIGSDNVVREFVTLHRGTEGGGGLTRIGSHNLFMAYAHVAHDCLVGSHIVFANSGTLAGHVEVGDRSTIGAFTSVHQFCRVGKYAFLGGYTVATKDCLPFMKTVGSRPAKCYGPNSIGLERQGFDEGRRKALKQAWRYLYTPKLRTVEALDKMRTEMADQPDVRHLVEFIETATAKGAYLAPG